MTTVLKRLINLIIITLIIISSSVIPVNAADIDDINNPDVFLKQDTAITCTLSSATMMLRRTAIIADFSEWDEITEAALLDVAWIDGVGLRWDFSFYGMTVGHGYYPDDTDKKLFMIDLLDKFPQGVVVYNTGKKGQNHAVFLCDYDSATDTFYVADPASNIPSGRIPLLESSIVGDTQADKIENLSAYWYVSTPEIRYENGKFTSSGKVSNPYDPTYDTASFEKTKTTVNNYYVVNFESTKGVAVRYYPSGSSSVAELVTKGSILYVTEKGKNNFGAEWYKLNSGYYIFNTNLISFNEYSLEIKKFNNTAASSSGTYKASSKNGKVAVRIEPAEGNNVVAEIKNDEMLYITYSGDNSAGAKWLKTKDGYYVKADDMTFVSAQRLEDSLYNGKYSLVTGEYKSEPSEGGNTQIPEYATGKYKITASALNLRKDAVNGEVYVSIPKNTVVEVVATADGWGKTTYGGYTGWIMLDYTQKVSDDEVYKIDSVIVSSDTLETGQSVTCTVNVSGADTVLYKFAVYNEDGDSVYSSQVYSTKNTISYKAEKSGSYYFFVEVKNADNHKLSTFSRNFTVRDKLQIKSVKSSVDEYVYVADEITWTVDTISVSGSAVYVYTLYCDGEMLFEKESRFNVFSFVPEKAGKYVLYATLSDGDVRSDTVKADDVTVFDSIRIEKIEVPLTAVTGSVVPYVVSAVGGTGEYQYCFTVFKEGLIVRSGLFTAEKSDSIVFEETGKYLVFCTVMDSSNMIASGFSQEITVIDALLGDVDKNGTVAAKDARLALRHSAKLEFLDEAGCALADINYDNKITAADARRILRCAAKLETF